MVIIPKAADFEIGGEEVAIQHQIFQPQIPVEDPLLMTILHTADELLEESASQRLVLGHCVALKLVHHQIISEKQMVASSHRPHWGDSCSVLLPLREETCYQESDVFLMTC